MSIIIKGISKAQFYKDLNRIPYMDVGWDIEELPPHGRLIDADALINVINQSITEQKKVFDSLTEDPIGKQCVWVDIMHDERIVRILGEAPTITDAEEDER